MTTDQDIWALLEKDAPAGCSAVQDLYSRSLNYDAGTGPFTAFLDLIGWSDLQIGQNLYDFDGLSTKMGYVELEKLAHALIEYSDRPHDVSDYVTVLMDAEMVS